jgi:CRISPR-associated endonuclease Cas1
VADGLEAITETFARHEAPGVTIVDGFGVRLRVEHSELEASDGIGPQRRLRRWARTDRTLRRVIVTARSGSVSIDAVRWVAGVGAALVVLDDRGVALAASPRGTDNVALRRAQALAGGSPLGLDIARYLLDSLLQGRARLARSRLGRPAAADTLDDMRSRLGDAGDVDELRLMEMSAAALWWSAWDEVALRWVAADRRRVPAAWTSWSGRVSVLGGAADARHATHPVNALANLGYRIAEVEATIAINSVGLDTAFGVSHTDRPGRDGFVLDVMEGLRPTVEEGVLELVDERPFFKRDFSEAMTGELRVASPLSHEFVELLTPRLTRAAGPIVEHVARMLAEDLPSSRPIATPLTRSARKHAGKAIWAAREARATAGARTRTSKGKVERRCEGCGVILGRQRRWCPECWSARREEAGRTGSAAARRALDGAGARAARGGAISSGRRGARDARLRDAGFEPDDWNDRILPALRGSGATAKDVGAATGLSSISCYRILGGAQMPDARHWPALVRLAKPEGTSRAQQDVDGSRRGGARRGTMGAE